MKDATRRWSTWSLGVFALVALTGWRSDTELMMSEGAPYRAPATELEFHKMSPPLHSDSASSHTSAVGGGLILLLSMGMVRSARARNEKRRSESKRLVPAPVVDLRNKPEPLPEEFQALIAELNEMAESFKDAS
jgi:hypothetical protein